MPDLTACVCTGSGDRGMSAQGLTTFDHHRLSDAVKPLKAALCDPVDGVAGIYLVGTALSSHTFHDVDVRLILNDTEFDRLFFDHRLWSAFCYATTAWLRAETGLPIDFQVQRMTEANEHGGPRSALGLPVVFAAGGDATPYSDRERCAL